MSSSPSMSAAEAVLVASQEMPKGSLPVKGYDFDEGVDFNALLDSYKYSGFQATNFGLAVEQINRMLDARVPLTEEEEELAKVVEEDEFIRRRTGCTLFLGYTSNMSSCGVRDVIRFLVKHKMVDCLVTTAGGVEEDLIKCLAPTYLGDFRLPGKELRAKGINRIGNLLVPNDNYCKFENWITPLLDQILKEQEEDGAMWSPSTLIERLGREMNHDESICTWASRNKIPIFSPALTDGSIGDMLYFHAQRKPGLKLDIIKDICRINNMAVRSKKTGMVIIGGGLVKHHVCNANLMRNGADFSVYLNTASEYDGSDSGAHPDEAVSWGKIRTDAAPVKVYGEASLIFPLLVGQTFAKRHHQQKEHSH